MISESIVEKNVISQRDIRNIKLWYLSFVLLFVAVMLFLFCFFNDEQLIVFVVLVIDFFGFIVMYIGANKRIKHHDGYTLIQAMYFYRRCIQSGFDKERSEKQFEQKIIDLARQIEYSNMLTNVQIINMYKIGNYLNIKLRGD